MRTEGPKYWVIYFLNNDSCLFTFYQLLDKKAFKKKLMANGSNSGQAKSPTKEQMDTGGIKFQDFKGKKSINTIDSCLFIF